jgi:hypothetical protein
MDAFEKIVGMLLERDGYWVRTSYKVRLSKQEKVNIGIPSSPRWELDVVAYRPKDNLVLVVECKSFLNSPGVRYEQFSGQAEKKGRYKLFTDGNLRKTVLACLKKQLRSEGLVSPHPKVRLCLAAGHICRGDRDRVKRHCRKNHWWLFDEEWFSRQFDELAKVGYENDIAIVAAKLAKTGLAGGQ